MSNSVPIYDNINAYSAALLKDPNFLTLKAQQEALLTMQEGVKLWRGILSALGKICEKMEIPATDDMKNAGSYLSSEDGVRRAAALNPSAIMDESVFRELECRLREQEYLAAEAGDPTGTFFSYETGRTSGLSQGPQQYAQPPQKQSFLSSVPVVNKFVTPQQQYQPPSQPQVGQLNINGNTIQYYITPPPGVTPKKMPGQIGWDMSTGQPIDQYGQIMQTTGDKIVEGGVEKIFSFL